MAKYLFVYHGGKDSETEEELAAALDVSPVTQLSPSPVVARLALDRFLHDRDRFVALTLSPEQIGQFALVSDVVLLVADAASGSPSSLIMSASVVAPVPAISAAPAPVSTIRVIVFDGTLSTSSTLKDVIANS